MTLFITIKIPSHYLTTWPHNLAVSSDKTNDLYLSWLRYAYEPCTTSHQNHLITSHYPRPNTISRTQHTHNQNLLVTLPYPNLTTSPYPIPSHDLTISTTQTKSKPHHTHDENHLLTSPYPQSKPSLDLTIPNTISRPHHTHNQNQLVTSPYLRPKQTSPYPRSKPSRDLTIPTTQIISRPH